MATRRNVAAAVEVSGLRKSYPGGVEAVRGIDLEIRPGEIFGLVGPNGAGKSTTIGMLTTTIRPTAGRARVAGFDVVRQALQARGVSSVVFQEPVVDRSLTGRKNLQIHAKLWGVPGRSGADLIEMLGIGDVIDRPMSTYSGGQVRRLEIARALVSDPTVLFLDEPTVGLDPLIRYSLIDAIASLRTQSDMTVLLTTHYLDEAERLCDRLAIMHEGELVALGTPRELLATLGQELIELRVEDDPDDALDELRAHKIAGDDAFAVGSTITVPLHRKRSVRALAVIDDLDLHATAIATRKPTLDDVFVRLTGDRVAV